MEEKSPNEQLRRERDIRGWSQRALAETLGTTEQVVNHWERGSHKPNRHFQTQLCQLFGKNAEELGFMRPPQATKEEGEARIDTAKENVAETVSFSLPPVTLQQGETPYQITSLSRRHALSLLAGVPLSLAGLGGLLHDEEMLSVCATHIPIFWRLYFDGQLSEIERALPSYTSQLALLVRQSSEYRQQAAHLASKAHQLACMLALQQQDYGLALIHVDQALFGADVAEDANLRVASLIRRALVYRYLKWFKPMLETYQEADQDSKSISPLLTGRLYTGLAEAHSNFEREYEARHFLEHAYKAFPENSKDDPHFSYTHFKLPQGFEAVMYLNLKKPKEAWDALTHVDESLPAAIVPDRVELSIDQARASFLLNEIRQCCKYLELAVTSASALGSNLRYNEAYSLYQQMQIKWPREQQVKALTEYF